MITRMHLDSLYPNTVLLYFHSPSALRPIRQHQKELQRQQELRLKQQRKQQQKEQQHQEKLMTKQFLEQMEKQESCVVMQQHKGPASILPKLPPDFNFRPTSHPQKPFPVMLWTDKSTRTTATQTTQPAKRKRGPSKKQNRIPSKSLLNQQHHHEQSLHRPSDEQSLQQYAQPIATQTLSSSSQFGNMNEHYLQDGGLTNMETQTSHSVSQSTNMFTQTRGDILMQNAMLSANIETQTSRAPQLVQSSTQYSNSYQATTAETQTMHRNMNNPSSTTLFDLDTMSIDLQERIGPHPAVQTQTSIPSFSSSNCQTDNWMSALYETHNSPIATASSEASLMTQQPSDVPTQTNLSFLDDMFGLSHSETQTMHSLASFMMESSSTQTPKPNQNTPCVQEQSTQVQASLAGFPRSLSYNISQGTSTQTQMANLPMSMGTATCTDSRQSTQVQTPMECLSGTPTTSFNMSQGTSTSSHMTLCTSTETSTFQSAEVQTSIADLSSPQSYSISQGTSTLQSTNTLQSAEVQTSIADLSSPQSYNISHGTSTLQSTNTSQSAEVQTSIADFSSPQSYSISHGTSTLQSTEVQTHMAGLIEPMSLNSSQTQTSFADLCLGGVLFPDSQNQTTQHHVPFRLDESLPSSHQETQTGDLTGHQSTQTAAEKELDVALSLLNQYTQTGQLERRNQPLQRRTDSLDSDLGFTSMHTQTMEAFLAVLDNDNPSTSVQTDFEAFTGTSFGVSVDRGSTMTSNSGVAVQTDTLDLSSLQELDFYSSSNTSSQT